MFFSGFSFLFFFSKFLINSLNLSLLPLELNLNALVHVESLMFKGAAHLYYFVLTALVAIC